MVMLTVQVLSTTVSIVDRFENLNKLSRKFLVSNLILLVKADRFQLHLHSKKQLVKMLCYSHWVWPMMVLILKMKNSTDSIISMA